MTPSPTSRLDPVCVYCGSSDSIRPEYLDAARAMGSAMAARGQTVVFGGGRTGMMGVLNALGYFDPLLELVDHARREGFIYAEHRRLFVSEAEPGGLLDRLEEFVSPEGLGRWVERR